MTKLNAFYRQGDVAFIPIATLPTGKRTKRKDGVAAYGEVTGHSHQLAVTDREIAEVLEIGDGLFVHVSDAGISLSGATFKHEEHAPITLPTGNYEIRIQQEYSPEAIRNVVD